MIALTTRQTLRTLLHFVTLLVVTVTVNLKPCNLTRNEYTCPPSFTPSLPPSPSR